MRNKKSTCGSRIPAYMNYDNRKPASFTGSTSCLAKRLRGNSKVRIQYIDVAVGGRGIGIGIGVRGGGRGRDRDTNGGWRMERKRYIKIEITKEERKKDTH